MKRKTSIVLLLVLVCIMALTLIACNKNDEVTIKKFVIEDLELLEGDRFDTSEVVIICHKSDGTTTEVTNNLVFDKSELEEEDILNDENVLSDDSAGEYTVPVYHLDIHIGDLKVIIKVKR